MRADNGEKLNGFGNDYFGEDEEASEHGNAGLGGNRRCFDHPNQWHPLRLSAQGQKTLENSKF